jgi:hypothetical protein
LELQGKAMQRTFLDYYKAYGADTFYDYAQHFLTWTNVQGYIPRHFSNEIYVYTNHNRVNFFNSERLVADDKDCILNQERALTDTYKSMGLNSGLYLDHLPYFLEKSVALSLAQDCCSVFLEQLFPKVNFNRSLEACSRGEVLQAFEKTARTMLDQETLVKYLFSLSHFIYNIPNEENRENYGFFLIKDLQHAWTDVGVLIYLKRYLSTEILFYQLGDSN